MLIERSSTEALAKKQGMSIEKYLETLGMCRKKLFDVRSKRPRPHLDDKVPCKDYQSFYVAISYFYYSYVLKSF